MAVRLHSYLDRDEFKRDWLWVGARPRTQPLELAWTLSQLVEKSLDSRSEGALAHCDVAAHYDSLDLLLCTSWLLDQPASLVDLAVAIAALRWQLLPQVTVDLGIVHFSRHDPTGGSATGSRTAGAFGRIPVEEAMRAQEDVLSRCAWRLGPRRFAASTFVDNLLFASDSLGGSLRMACAVERELRSRWLLRIKPTSREAMLVAGAPEIPELEAFGRAWPGWSFSRMLLSNKGSVIQDRHESARISLGLSSRTSAATFAGHCRRPLVAACSRASLSQCLTTEVVIGH